MADQRGVGMTQIWAVDLDGTVSSTPEAMKAIMDGLRAQGCEVHVLSAVKDGPATQEAAEAKRSLLASLGCGDSYDKLIAVSGPKSQVATGKVSYMRHVNATALIDNDKRNVKAARKAGFLAFRHMTPKGRRGTQA